MGLDTHSIGCHAARSARAVRPGPPAPPSPCLPVCVFLHRCRPYWLHGPDRGRVLGTLWLAGATVSGHGHGTGTQLHHPPAPLRGPRPPITTSFTFQTKNDTFLWHFR